MIRANLANFRLDALKLFSILKWHIKSNIIFFIMEPNALTAISHVCLCIVLNDTLATQVYCENTNLKLLTDTCARGAQHQGMKPIS